MADKLSERLAKLTLLFTAAVTLIQKGSRSDEMIETLLRALQLFKENRLRPEDIESPPTRTTQ